MGINKLTYRKYTDKRGSKSPLLKNCLCAFVVGGLICTVGQGLGNLFISLGIDEKTSGLLTSVSLIFASVLLTGIGVFDKIAKFSGAGTLVPITGFANAVASAAIDNKSEGFVMGVGAKIFTIAGPVILYGISAGVVYGIIYLIIGVIF